MYDGAWGHGLFEKGAESQESAYVPDIRGTPLSSYLTGGRFQKPNWSKDQKNTTAKNRSRIWVKSSLTFYVISVNYKDILKKFLENERAILWSIY